MGRVTASLYFGGTMKQIFMGMIMGLAISMSLSTLAAVYETVTTYKIEVLK